MKKLSFLAVCSALMLSACSKSPVDIVKGSYIDGARTTTVANGLGKRALCKSVQWDSFKDGKGRMVVQYRCSIVDGDDFLKEQRTSYVKWLTKDAEQAMSRARVSYESGQQRVTNDFPDTRKTIDHWQRKIEEYQALPKIGLTEREKISSFQFQKNQAEQFLVKRRQEAQLNLRNAESEIEDAKKRIDPERIKKEALRGHPVYRDTAEIFQWIVNGEERTVLTYGEMQARDANGQEVTIMKYNRPEQVISFASQDQHSKILEYLQSIGLASFVDMLRR